MSHAAILIRDSKKTKKQVPIDWVIGFWKAPKVSTALLALNVLQIVYNQAADQQGIPLSPARLLLHTFA